MNQSLNDISLVIIICILVCRALPRLLPTSLLASLLTSCDFVFLSDENRQVWERLARQLRCGDATQLYRYVTPCVPGVNTLAEHVPNR